MEEKINIAEILKDKQQGTKLYSILSDGECFLNETSEDSIYIDIDNRERFWCLSAYGSTHSFPNGCVLLFPSKEMRDWSKFAWKKGDVLINSSGFQCIFKEWASDDYTKFNGCYSNSRDGYEDVSNAETAKFDKLDNNIAYGYVREIERKLGGILNLETLDIEKTQTEFKDGDIVALVVRKCTHIAIFQSRQEAYIGFHAVLCQNDELLLEEPFREDVGDIELRLATDSEKQQLFDALAKEGKRWDSEKKQIVDLKPAFEIGKLYVFNEQDEDGELTIIGKLVAKNESEDTLTFGNQYEIENEKFVTDQTFDLRISVNKELREATDDEYCTFREAYYLWEKSKEKKSEEQSAFKTFDKVLVSNGEEYNWQPAFFVSDRGEGAIYRYKVLPIQSGKVADFAFCIPFEGNEHLAFTSDPF